VHDEQIGIRGSLLFIFSLSWDRQRHIFRCSKLLEQSADPGPRWVAPEFRPAF